MMLHTKYQGLSSCGFLQKDFIMFHNFSVIVTVCHGPGAQGIYSTHGTPSFMHPLWLQKRNSGCILPLSYAYFALKGTATLMISMFNQKELYEPRNLIQVSSKSVEKLASYGHLKNSIWPTFCRHFEYLISFQNFFNCLIFSYNYYHIICVSAEM